MKRPRRIRLYDNAYNRLLAESHITDFAGDAGEIRWSMADKGEIAVGGQVIFTGIAAE